MRKTIVFYVSSALFELALVDLIITVHKGSRTELLLNGIGVVVAFVVFDVCRTLVIPAVCKVRGCVTPFSVWTFFRYSS